MRRAVHLFTRVANTPRLLVAAVVGVWLTCSWTYAVIEDKGPVEALWWGIVTGSTVGYGDYYPSTTAGRFVGAVLIVTMLVLTAIAISQLSAKLIVDRDAFTHEEQEEIRRLQRENNAMLRALCEGRDIDVEAVVSAARSGTSTREQDLT